MDYYLYLLYGGSMKGGLFYLSPKEIALIEVALRLRMEAEQENGEKNGKYSKLYKKHFPRD